MSAGLGSGRGKVIATRMALLACKAQIILAEQGRELLEQKRSALMKEIMRVAGEIMAEAGVLQQAADEAQRALARSEAAAGSQAVQSAALAARGEYPLRVETVNVMGVKVPRFEGRSAVRPMLGRGYAPVGSSITIDEAAAAFENEVNAIVRLAESELRLVRLTGEIQRTSRRVNALKHLVIPRLESEREAISLTLDERERADRFRLKLAKRSLAREPGS
jgi:V/A-type H+-transporting ATPase subunit D